MNSKKIIALVLCVILALALFAGCNGKQPATPTPEPTQAPATPAPTQAPERARQQRPRPHGSPRAHRSSRP